MRDHIRQVSIHQVPDPLPTGVVVLDVRETEEWDAGHIEGAVHIPLAELPYRVAEVPTEAQVVAVCRVGARSAVAAAFLQAAGHDVVNLSGGMVAWQHAGRPFVSSGGGPASVV
jgi:rhodanese-related sulfurtransferase